MKRSFGVAIFSLLVVTASVGGPAAVAGASGPAATPATPAGPVIPAGPAGHRGGVPAAPGVSSPAVRAPLGAPHTVVPGSWSLATAPSPSTVEDSGLYGVSCVSGSFCVAVGYNEPTSFAQTLIEQWNGTTWSIVTSPNSSTTEDNVLEGVSCVSVSFCVAVGFADGTSVNSALVEQWNGSAWSIVASPHTTATGNYLYGVDCTSTSFCLAVGETADGGLEQTLGMEWNGTAWSVVATPSASSTLDNYLYAVSCISTGPCTAVGVSYTAGDIGQTLIEQWNGAVWSIMPSPNTSATVDNILEGVSCASASFCVADGYTYQPGGTSAVEDNSGRTFIEQWNGSAWSIVSSPNTSDGYGNYLYGVSCTGPTSCVAAGWLYTDSSATTYVTLALAWNGTSWTLQSTPNPVETDNYSYLEAVSCLAGQTCVAVGVYYPSNDYSQPLILSAPNTRPGYRFVASDGGVFDYGGAPFYGSTGSLTLNKPVVGMAGSPDGGGYWLVASDGGIFAYGDAPFYGSTGSLMLNKPIVGMASTPLGDGYWLVASDGGIFAYGDAKFYGSTGSLTLNKPIVGMATTPDGNGYWLVASDGGIFAYGDAAFYGSTGSLTLNKPIVGMASTPDGLGYWLVASDGGIFNFGSVPLVGSMGGQHLNAPIVDMAS